MEPTTKDLAQVRYAGSWVGTCNKALVLPWPKAVQLSTAAHLLSEGSLEKIWSLRQKEDAERSRAAEGSPFSWMFSSDRLQE